MPLSKMVEASSRTLLRVLHYPPMTGNEEVGAIRAAAHEDINLLTVYQLRMWRVCRCG